MKKLAFTAVFFAVVALDLLDQGKAAGFTFWSVLSTVCTALGIFLAKKNQKK